MFITDFAFHSVGVVLTRLGNPEAFLQFARDTLIDGHTGMVSIGAGDLDSVVEAVIRFGLDFDDAYQYAAAKLSDLQIVSFDSDFDGTDRGRRHPSDL